MVKAKRKHDGPRLFKKTLVPAEPGSDEFIKTEYEGGREAAGGMEGMRMRRVESLLYLLRMP